MTCFDLKIGFKCNNNCKHCVVADKRNTADLSMDEITHTIKSIHNVKNTFVQITGGEPTIYETLPDILKLCYDRGLATAIQTNGTGFADEGFLLKCKPYINHVHIAIHSCVPEIHDTIVGTEGMWKKTIQGLDNLIKHNIFFTTQTVLSQYNIDTIYDTFDFIQNKKFGTHMSLTYPHLMGNALHNAKDVAFRYSDKKEIIQKTLEKFHEFLYTESIPYCYLHPYAHQVMVHEYFILKNDGRIGLDCANSRDILNDYNRLDLKDHRKAPLCKNCMYNSICIGVWKEYIELFKNNLDLYPIVVDENDDSK